MNKIKAKIYFLVSTGEVLVITSEMQGSVEPTTKEKDMEDYSQLNDKSIDDIDYIELEYGTLANTFTNSKSYSINLETKSLDVVYFTQEELDAMKIKDQETQDLNSRVSDIAEYLNSNEKTIAAVEDLILQSEQNKILEGMM